MHKPCLSPREPLRPLAVTPVKRGLYMSNDVKMARLGAGVQVFFIKFCHIITFPYICADKYLCKVNITNICYKA